MEGGRSIAIEGPSGVGKSTVAETLARLLGAELVPEAYDLLEPRPSLSYRDAAGLERIERTLLRQEAERYRRTDRALQEGRSVVLDTGFLGPLAYTAGVSRGDADLRTVTLRVAREAERLVRAGSLGLPTVILYLDLDEAAVARRASAALRTHPRRWRERHASVARWERRLWTWEYPRQVPHRLGVVRATGPVEGVVQRLVRRLAQLGAPPPVPRPLAVRVIHAFAAIPSSGSAAAAARASGPAPERPTGNR